jgi:hypothetical protein
MSFHSTIHALALASSLAPAWAASFSIDQPAIDRWMYPYAVNGGGQGAIQTFGAVRETDFDDRDGQMFLRFDTTSIMAAGLGAANYQLTALTLTLTLTLSSTGTIYDPTSDSLSTYLPSGVDADPGRPIEVFGVGYRNGASAETWQENSSFGPAGKGTRSAFALGYNATGEAIDVSNNVSEGFDATPWAVGSVAGATPGSALAADTMMTFAFNLGNADVLAYLQAGLDQGFLDLMVTSLYPAEQPGAGDQTAFPVFYAKESIYNLPASNDPFDHVAGRLSGSVEAVPEPSAVILLILAATGWGAVRAGRRIVGGCRA